MEPPILHLKVHLKHALAVPKKKPGTRRKEPTPLEARAPRTMSSRGGAINAINAIDAIDYGLWYGGFHKWGTQNGWFIVENSIKMDDLGIAQF